jgi:hypothetical protein
MPQFSMRAFASDSNQMRSGQDYINRKKAETLYTTISTNRKTNKTDNLAVLISPGSGTSTEYDISRCLFNVGGFNVNSYDLYLNLAKGRYYTATTGRNIGIDPSKHSGLIAPSPPDINNTVVITDCSGINISSTESIPSNSNLQSLEIERTGVGNIYDGTLLVNMNSLNDLSGSGCGCYTDTLMDISNVGIDATMFDTANIPLQNIAGKHLARLAIEQPLRGFDFPSKFSIPRPPQN